MTINIKYQSFGFLIIIFFVFSCKNKTGIEGEKNQDNNVLIGDNNTINVIENSQNSIVEFKEVKRTFSETLDETEGEVVEVKVNISYLEPISFSNKSVLNKIKGDLAKEFFSEKNINNDILSNINKMANNFIRETKSNYEDTGFIEYVFRLELVPIYNQNDFLSIKKEGHYNQGGVRLKRIHEYYNYDLVSGKKISYNDVFLYDIEFALTRKIEKKIIDFHQLNSEDLNSFWERNPRKLDRFYFTESGICFVFAQHSYLAYSGGITNICFSYDEISMYFDESFPLRMANKIRIPNLWLQKLDKRIKSPLKF